jgi:multimeric flavodoxin WrbA
MKVVVFNGSPRKNGNTATAISAAVEELNKEGIETEVIQIGHLTIKGCVGCGACRKTTPFRCVYNDAAFDEWVDKARAADGIIIGSPVYYAGINGTVKSFLDRLFYQSSGLLRQKAASCIAIARRAGGVSTVDQINHFFLNAEMFIAPGSYWTAAYGQTEGQVEKDEEGMAVVRMSAKNMAYLLKLKAHAGDAVPAPERLKYNMTHYIR